MSELYKDVRYLKGVGEQRAKLLGKLGIFTLRDLLCCYPRAYEDRTQLLSIADAPLEQNACIAATVAAAPVLNRVRRGMELVKLRAVDDTGAVDITYFNQAYIRDLLRPGETYVFYGKIGGTSTRKTMMNPDFEPEGRRGQKTGCIMPRYHLCRGLSNRVMMNYTRTALELVGSEVPDALPQEVCSRFQLAQAAYAYENIHFPTDMGALELARRRLVFEELFVLACALTRVGTGRRTGAGPVIGPFDTGVFYDSLAFSPTGAQQRAVADCLKDMASGRPMNRLVQGDVGSGKTLVAAACAWSVCRSGRQAAFMAPTEILAQQHWKTLSGLLSPFGLRTDRLTGAMTAKEKRAKKQALASGEIDLIIGTHALLTEDVSFRDLALVITDEQHRFGVDQRGALTEKGASVHVLVMSATPIPRTLALMIYGDLDVSIIDELPPGRQKVDTFVVDSSYRTRLNGFIEKLVGEGRQVFVVCPMVEENEESELDLKSASEHARELQKRFPALRVGCVHGKMKPKEKDAVMAAVVNGEIDILVSTTVIEVGVDVPNAALMVIENAERFGLSQLHQLRGRVGRGKHKSWCILVSDSCAEEAQARLKALCTTNDGFKISEEDLRLRGPGDFFGSRQHGLPEMHIANLCGDVALMQQAQDAALEVLRADPELSWPGHSSLRRRTDELLEASLRTFN